MAEQPRIDESAFSELFQIERAGDMSGGLIEDPYPVWAQRLAEGPVHSGNLAECTGLSPERIGGTLYQPGIPCFSVFSFAAVSDVFIRKEDFSSEAYIDAGVRDEFGDTILNMDGARHRRYRDLIQRQFQPAAAETWWRGQVLDELVESLLDELEGRRSADLSTSFFAGLPLHTVVSGFGLSLPEGIEFRRHMLDSLNTTSMEVRAAATAAAGSVLDRVIRERQRAPRDDLISKLAHADLEGEDEAPRKLTVEEIASFCRLIVFAGGETTWRQLGSAFFTLMEHPDQLADLLADRSLMQNAILESLRWNADPMFPRKVRRDTQLHGVDLPAGAHLHLCLGAANRDPSRWEDPHRFDIHRPVQRSLAFGAGAHSCLGQHVARQEIGTALNALFDRFPGIRWDPSRPKARLTGNLSQRGPTALHVLLH